MSVVRRIRSDSSAVSRCGASSARRIALRSTNMVGCSVPAMVILALIQLVMTKSSDFPSNSDTALERVCKQLDFSESVSARLEVT